MRKVLFFLLVIIVLLGVETRSARAEEAYRFAVTDIVGLEELQREFHTFQKVLSEKAGVTFELFPVSGRTVVVEAFRSRKLDFALTGPAEYVIISNKTKARPVVGLTRPDYYSVIITRAGSGIGSLQDLKGKKIAFGDYGSTSYHLAPLQIISDAGLDPLNDVDSINVSKQVAWKAFVRGQVDAIGMSQLRFVQFSASEKSVSPDSFQVVAKGPQLPNDLIIAAEHVPDKTIQKVRQAFAEHSQEMLQAILVGQRNQKYRQMGFLTDIKDADYDYVRKMYQTAGFPEFSGKNARG